MKNVKQSDGTVKRIHFTSAFNTGNLVIPDIELSYTWGHMIMDFKPHYDGFNRAVFVGAMIQIFKHPNYDHERMMARLNANPGMLVHCVREVQYKKLIEDIFNFRSRDKKTLRY